MKGKLLFLLLLSVALISSVSATGNTLISDIKQGQTEVKPSQTISIGGGTPALILSDVMTAGTPFQVSINITNPNDYAVAGTLWINFTKTAPSTEYLAPADILIYTPNGDVTLTVNKYNLGMSCFYLYFHIMPTTAPYLFIIQPGLNINLTHFSLLFNAPGTYSWTMWFTNS